LWSTGYSSSRSEGKPTVFSGWKAVALTNYGESFMETIIDEERIKKLFKEALVEVLEERKELLHELLAEVIEDIALARAIQEGEDTVPVSKQEVLKLLDESA
jgi:hypothetical protein